jgi:hypothetical protein
VAENPIPSVDKALAVTVSIGLAAYAPGHDIEKLFQRADAAPVHGQADGPQTWSGPDRRAARTETPPMDVAIQRLRHQRLVGRPFARPEDAVRWLGAVQSQDYAGAKWAVAQRTRACTDDDVERAFADARILRTHVLRPTWHFVLPDDIRWMLALTAPRVRATMAYYERKLALDAAVFRRSQAVLEKALVGGNALTRDELGRALGAAGIAASGERLGLIMMRAELDALIASGPRRGKQFTYALLDERAPRGPDAGARRGAGRARGRYFASHGPALPQRLRLVVRA